MARRAPDRSPARSLDRARPLLGTIVRIRVDPEEGGDGNRAIDAAFAEIAAIHRLMSFQEAASDIGRLNRAGGRRLDDLDPRTLDCTRRALDWAAASGGVFDPVASGGTGGCWTDLAIDETGMRLAAGRRIDLSGIAKGHAVDRACAVLVAAGVSHGVVEAGGDLRVIGAREESIALAAPPEAPPAIVRLADGAIASSDPARARAEWGVAAHLDGRDGSPAPDHFVSVVAPCCVDADALTKIVLVLDDAAANLLARATAVAHRFDGARWSTIGDAG